MVMSAKDVRQTFGLPCKDGWVTIFMLGGGLQASVEHLKRLRNWMDEEGMAPDWLKQLDFVWDYSSEKLTQELVDRVEGTYRDFLMTKTKAELFERAIQDGLILAPVSSAKDAWENEQLRAREYWQQVEHPELGDSIPYCGPFIQLSGTPIRIRRRPPLIGEHNMEIYSQELGVPLEKLAILKHSGVI